MGNAAALYGRFSVKLRAGFGDDRWVSVRCFNPEHDDRHPSCRVHLGHGGFRCWGCGVHGDAVAALQLLGVRDIGEAIQLANEYGVRDPARPKRVRARRSLPGVRTGQPPPNPAAAAEGPARAAEQPVDYDRLQPRASVKLERSWTYLDEDGRPVGRVIRQDLSNGEKRIWQERLEHGRWLSGLAGRPLPLYQLPAVRRRAAKGERILIVEGEKSVDALERLGFFATTNAGGAGKWRPDHTAALAGAVALAVMDCDLQGRYHAIQLSRELLAAGNRVLTPVDPDPGRNDGYDIVDHLAGVANTVRAVSPEISDQQLRDRLRDHLRARLLNQVNTDSGQLQRLAERAEFSNDPAGHAWLSCDRCQTYRVHQIKHGIAYCPCGAHQLAP